MRAASDEPSSTPARAGGRARSAARVGGRGRTEGEKPRREEWEVGGHEAPFAPSLPRSRRRRRSAAAAPAAILGSLCGGGDDPRLGCGTRLPSVSPAEPRAFPFSSLAFPPVRSPAGRLLTSGRDPLWTKGSGGAWWRPSPLPHSPALSSPWASASDTRKRCWLHILEIPVFCGTQFCKIFLGFLGNNIHL